MLLANPTFKSCNDAIENADQLHFDCDAFLTSSQDKMLKMTKAMPSAVHSLERNDYNQDSNGKADSKKHIEIISMFEMPSASATLPQGKRNC